MRKEALTVICGAVLGLVAIMIVVTSGRKAGSNKSLAELVTELGRPSFLATRTEIVKRQVKALRIQVIPLDPRSVTNWNSITNAVAIWVKSEAGQRNARYFYDEMKNDKSFDGAGFYSSRPLFGENLTMVKIDARGKVIGRRALRVDAISMKLEGFVPHGRSARQDEGQQN